MQNAEDKDNSVILAKQMEEQLKADCAALEAQETAAFDAEVTTTPLATPAIVINFEVHLFNVGTPCMWHHHMKLWAFS